MHPKNSYSLPVEQVGALVQTVQECLKKNYDPSRVALLSPVDLYIQLLSVLAQCFYYLDYCAYLESLFDQQVFSLQLLHDPLATESHQTFVLGDNAIVVTLQVSFLWDSEQNCLQVNTAGLPDQREEVIRMQQSLGISDAKSSLQA